LTDWLHIPSGQRVSVRDACSGEWLVGFSRGQRLPDGKIAEVWTEVWVHPDEVTMRLRGKDGTASER